jgi:6-pyruvoyltetrahydropterin/6-carboxytetrahydropterin synthase
MPSAIVSRYVDMDAAHRVPNHLSKCKSLHGHRYRVILYVRGLVQEDDQACPEHGMVVDFGVLKTILQAHVHDPCDHGMILQHDDELLHVLGFSRNHFANVKESIEDQGYYAGSSPIGSHKLYLIEGPPTAENLAVHFWRRIHEVLPESMKLHCVEVRETEKCSAIHFGK